MELKIGGIYRLDRTRFFRGGFDIKMLIFTSRVLGYDRFEVFSDHIPPSESDWLMNKKYKGLFWFGKFSMIPFDEDAVEIGFEEFSNELLEYYRTDLVFRLSRLKEVSWNDELFNSETSFLEYVKKTQSVIWLAQKIDCRKVYLVPTGNSGGFKTPVLFDADNKEYFSATEILWKASQLQRQYFTVKSSGVGVFRGGIKKGIPFYYISQYLGSGEYLKEWEEMGIDTNV